MTARVSIQAQAAVVERLLGSGAVRKMGMRGSEADLTQEHLRAAAETLRWLAMHPEAVEAAKAAVKRGDP